MTYMDLTHDERLLLRYGLNQWGGPARCTDAFALAMGFNSREHLHEDLPRLIDALEAEAPLKGDDWRRVLLATEVVFISDIVGAGLDWSIVTGFLDEVSIQRLRSIQRKMPRWRGSFQFDSGVDREVRIRDADRSPEGR